MNVMKKKVGLALGSGAARGLAHIGVIKALEEYNIPIRMIAGTSMGALVGAAYATGLSGTELEEIACTINFRTIAKLFLPTLPITGLVDGKRIEDFLKALVGDVNIRNLKIPFAAVAADIESSEEILIRDGSLIGAIRASISIPGIFTPAKHQNRYLVDGGLLNPVPVDVVRNMGADFVIAVSVPYPQKDKPVDIIIALSDEDERSIKVSNLKDLNDKLTIYTDKKVNIARLKSGIGKIIKRTYKNKSPKGMNIFKIIMTTMNIMERQITYLQLAKHKPDLLIKPDIEIASAFDFYKAREIIKLGESEAKKALEKIF